MKRYDYAVFTDEQYSHNAMLTRREAKSLEAQGLRCVDVAASIDANLPRFRDRRYVGPTAFKSRWHGR